VVGLAILGPGAAHAGGFYVPEIGPRAPAMGAAMTAQAADASSVFHNPAALSGQVGTEVQVVGAVFFPRVTFYRRPVDDPGTDERIHFAGVRNTNRVGAAPYVGARTDFGRGRVSAGVALYVPFGAALSYPDDGSQRHVVTHVELVALHLSPAVAYRVSDSFAVGVSLNAIFAELALEQKNAVQYVTGDPEVFPDPDPEVEGDTVLAARDPFSLGATLGALYRDGRGRFQLGASVLLPVTLRFSGTADVHNPAITELMDESGNVTQPAGERHDRIRTEIPLPLVARVGVAARLHPQAQVAFDVNWQRWSTFSAMTIDFENEHELLPTPGAELYDVTVANHWRDTFSLRLGAEVVPRPGSPWRLRGGVLYDQSPIDDAYFDLVAPDSGKVGVGGGLGRTFVVGGRLVDLDLAYQHLFLGDRDVSPETGSAKTILNKPAPSFYYGVTRARFDILYLSVGVRL
jgi:long-chain fatty acid transport protein